MHKSGKIVALAAALIVLGLPTAAQASVTPSVQLTLEENTSAPTQWTGYDTLVRTGEANSGEELIEGQIEGSASCPAGVANSEWSAPGYYINLYNGTRFYSEGPFHLGRELTYSGKKRTIAFCAYLTTYVTEKSGNRAYTVHARASLVVSFPSTQAGQEEEAREAEAAARKAREEAERRASEEKYRQEHAAKEAAEAARERANQEQRQHQREDEEAKRRAACRGTQEVEWEKGQYYSSEYHAGEYSCSAEEALQYKAELEARDKARREQEDREWAALREVDLARPGTLLKVTALARPGRSSNYPGHTTLRIVTSPFAFVTIKLRRYGHSTQLYENYPAALTSRTATIESEIVWSCRHPSGVYSYTITAHTNVGSTLTRKGAFRPVSVGRCHALERQEREAAERSEAHARTEREREQHEQAERTARFKENCRKENGTPRLFNEEGGYYWRCVAPGGGFLNVPY